MLQTTTNVQRRI
eukprot:CCRYP_013537-RA/>CCRYP_013537-RA protein AED:0.48 eAED:0.48 QI:0/-1/0/1/-1/0/1/0/12